MIIMAL